MQKWLCISILGLAFPAFAGSTSYWQGPNFCKDQLIQRRIQFRSEDLGYIETIKNGRKNQVPFFFAKDDRGRIALFSQTESEGNQILNDIDQWNESLGIHDALKKSSPDKRALSEGGYLFDVSSLIPNPAAYVHEMRAYDHGPNCWEFACYLTGSIGSIAGGMQENEFAYWLNSSSYRKLSPGESPKTGDLIAIREFRGEQVRDIHGAYYISPRLALSKKSISHEDQYLLERFDEVFGDYMAKLPKSCVDPKFWNQPECKRFVEIYRAQDSVKNLKKQDLQSLPELVIKSLPDLKKFERRLTDQWVREIFPTRAEQNEVFAFVDAQSKLAKEQIQILSESAPTAQNQAAIESWKAYWGRVAHLEPESAFAPWKFKP